MNFENLTFLDLTLGGAVVAGALMLWRGFIQRMGTRSESEGGLDERAVRLGGFMDQLLEDERAEKKRLQDALFSAHERHAQLAANMLEQNSEQIQRVRAEQREAAQHLHKRLDDCLAQHEECREQHADALRQISELRTQMQGQRA